MIDLSSAEIENMVIHIIGNKMRQEGLRLSNKLTSIEDDGIKELMFRHFLKPFNRIDSLYCFTHNSNLSFNEIFVYSKKIFKNINSFYELSSSIARHLYESSTHPRIQKGEFFMLYISKCRIEGNLTDAIGLFKAETKETFLKVTESAETFNISTEEGISINRLDKGCLIFNIANDDGFRIAIIDNQNKSSEEAKYWKEQFLSVSSIQTNDVVTQQYIELCSKVIEDIYPSETFGEKLDKKSRTLEYFSSNDTFNINQFVEEVMDNSETTLNEFSRLKAETELRTEINLPETFAISQRAVNKSNSRTKNVIHLDKTFDIYIKGQPSSARSNLERSYDSKRNMNFYKIYFHEEK